MFLVCFAIACPLTAQFTLEEYSDRIDVLHDDQLLTSYQFRSGSKPVLWPILGPDRQKMTRSYPLDDSAPGEEHDHPHHRGLWMTFGEVDDWDWWAEGKERGTVVHRRVVDKGASSSEAFLVAEHEWMTPTEEGKESMSILSETCRFTFHIEDGEHIIDCEYVLKSPSAGKPVHFGDTKEGMFAIRVPESMRADRPSGEMLNSSGDRGGDVWGKSARWVDYSGPTVPGGEDIYGIAILVHPQSFRSQGLWHARTYGLFAHNPFGVKDFLPNRTKTESGQQEPPHPGGYLLPANESLHLMYRVILHRDRWSLETGNRHWDAFVQLTPRLR
jgi:hypothetical protein